MNETVRDSIDLKTDSECIAEVEKFADIYFQKVSIMQEMYGKVYLVLIEAVENAIFHGNKKDSEKRIFVQLEKTEKEIILDIKDMGKGFDMASIPDPTLPENIENPHGRGIFLISNLSDKLEYNDIGNEVKITFNLN